MLKMCQHHLGDAGKNLQAQYERWQPRAKYRMHLDPTMDDVKKLAVSSRRAAKVCCHMGAHMPLCIPAVHCKAARLLLKNLHYY